MFVPYPIHKNRHYSGVKKPHKNHKNTVFSGKTSSLSNAWSPIERFSPTSVWDPVFSLNYLINYRRQYFGLVG